MAFSFFKLIAEQGVATILKALESISNYKTAHLRPKGRAQTVHGNEISHHSLCHYRACHRLRNLQHYGSKVQNKTLACILEILSENLISVRQDHNVGSRKQMNGMNVNIEKQTTKPHAQSINEYPTWQLSSTLTQKIRFLYFINCSMPDEGERGTGA